MTMLFEVGASVILVGKDLQFTGMIGSSRVHFVITNAALQHLAGSARELTRQQKFQAYDRNRAHIQEAARRVWDRTSIKTKAVKIYASDL